mgnify:CR=1 FL=1
MKYKITEQKNYTLIEIMEFQLNENHYSNLKELLTDIKSKKIKHVILNMKSITHFNISILSALLFGNTLFKELGSFVLCEIPLNLEKIIKANPSVEKIDFLPTLEEAIEFVMLSDQENMLKNEV